MRKSRDAQFGRGVGNQREVFLRLRARYRALRHGVGYAVHGAPCVELARGNAEADGSVSGTEDLDASFRFSTEVEVVRE